jgi:hypothetical protein
MSESFELIVYAEIARAAGASSRPKNPKATLAHVRERPGSAVASFAARASRFTTSVTTWS